MKKPIIGVNCNINPYQGQDGILNLEQLYVEAIYQAGGIPQIIPFLKELKAIDELIELYDGLLMTGGGGLLPNVQKMNELPGLFEQNPIRHSFDLALLKAAMQKGIPIMGVCRGHQTINEFLGGTTENIGDTSHLQEKSGTEPMHKIYIKSHTLLERCVQQEEVDVNSFHRQRISRLGKGLKASAYAHDGTIEAIEGTNYQFLLGVQFHPEFMLHHPSMFSIYKAFVQAAS